MLNDTCEVSFHNGAIGLLKRGIGATRRKFDTVSPQRRETPFTLLRNIRSSARNRRNDGTNADPRDIYDFENLGTVSALLMPKDVRYVSD